MNPPSGAAFPPVMNPPSGAAYPPVMNPPSGAAYPPVMNPPSGAAYPPVMNPPSGAAYFNQGYSQNPVYRNGPPSMSPPTGGRSPFKKPGRKRRFPIWARVLVAALALFIVISGSLYAYYQANYANSINNITGHQAVHHVNIETTDSHGNKQNQTTSNDILSGKRINILLLGSDNDGKGGNNGIGGSPLAQTDIVITIDPTTHYVGMLSIPRDLRVTIPGHGSGKMDFAFSYGFQLGGKDFTNSVTNGAGLAEDTIAYNFGIHIDYYAWVGLSGFVKVIDTAGGVDVDVIHPMVDDNYPDDVNKTGNTVYDYKRVYIAPGPQHLNGVQALEYVRTRHSDLVGDFGRSARQQQILSQLKTKLATPDTINKAPDLLKDLQDALKTDLTVSNMIAMGNFARSLDTNNIDRITLGPPTFASSIANTTDYAPICAPIRDQIAKMFDVQSKCIPQADASTGAAVAQVTNSQPNLALTTAPQAQASLATSLQAVTNETTERWQYVDPKEATHTILNLMLASVFGDITALE
ncbi:hypothetical protein KTT_42730 [Tengunoibacter tsumagoiensis]|uniref:Cell envelope-related transcriptional attenuator domain-containing protein n=2 Tax=Tengunoibacter tsumagoiensis TaxID=2014871 RepID=A0A402A5J9_9CHLR|nr:hypothetical protein KTT_42730 [Tengunoibacter tsumagoiensis]